MEEKGIDYTSFHLNPVTGKNMNASFFRMNPSATLPVFQNGDHKIFKTIEIIQYVTSPTLPITKYVKNMRLHVEVYLDLHDS